ncbi:hypothetical protein ACKUB1_11780 [Methanospirillum stamsii]|uniref:hypothetical protein n=1 Tax=Methanospirillum stamsii TaxID=1277351 RepID=UPI001C644B61|nr:hypothetical protein [Methanospirillum stamsii]
MSHGRKGILIYRETGAFIIEAMDLSFQFTDQKRVNETFRGMPKKSHVVYQKNSGYIREIFEGLPIVQMS